jgi:hypothetical protein
MGILRWLKRRFGTFDLLPQYFKAAHPQFLDILWGIGVGAAVPYVIFGLYSLFKTPPQDTPMESAFFDVWMDKAGVSNAKKWRIQ